MLDLGPRLSIFVVTCIPFVTMPPFVRMLQLEYMRLLRTCSTWDSTKHIGLNSDLIPTKIFHTNKHLSIYHTKYTIPEPS